MPRNLQRLLLSGLIGLVSVASVASPSNCVGGADSFGVASFFNLFVLGDVQHVSTDTQGRVAVGGDAYFDHYSIAEKILPQTGDYPYSLVVGGNLTFSNGTIYSGAVAYGGYCGMSSDDAVVYEGTYNQRPIDFVSVAQDLSARSASLAALKVNGQTVLGDKEITLTGGAADFAVFSIQAADLARVTFLKFEVPAGATVIVQVVGQTASLHQFGFDLGGASADHILFHFPQATRLSLNHVGIQGSVFAPLADVDFTEGVIHGQLIAHSLKGNGQMNLPLFASCLPIK
jgi:choice-of-anchor A domain-containing protein